MTIEKLFKRARGLKEDDHHYFQEMVINSDNLIHIFVRAKENEEHILGAVCRASANLGMALTKTRNAVSQVEAAA